MKIRRLVQKLKWFGRTRNDDLTGLFSLKRAK